MKKEFLAVYLFVMFGYNFPRPEDFIGYICEQTGKSYLKPHLLAKWNHYYETFGCRSVMNDFYTELDADLQQALIDYAVLIYAPRGMKSVYEKLGNL
jgi:hypothetical protein